MSLADSTDPSDAGPSFATNSGCDLPAAHSLPEHKQTSGARCLVGVVEVVVDVRLATGGVQIEAVVPT